MPVTPERAREILDTLIKPSRAREIINDAKRDKWNYFVDYKSVMTPEEIEIVRKLWWSLPGHYSFSGTLALIAACEYSEEALYNLTNCER